MAAAGARIVAVDIDGAAAERAAKAIDGAATSYVCDVAERAACDALAATVRRDIGPISILVNNAGVTLPVDGGYLAR
jgi:NAD(P)-dependent dehydrogenase (short-subunit alcohol dehydrogenase family)